MILKVTGNRSMIVNTIGGDKMVSPWDTFASNDTTAQTYLMWYPLDFAQVHEQGTTADWLPPLTSLAPQFIDEVATPVDGEGTDNQDWSDQNDNSDDESNQDSKDEDEAGDPTTEAQAIKDEIKALGKNPIPSNDVEKLTAQLNKIKAMIDLTQKITELGWQVDEKAKLEDLEAQYANLTKPQ